jgi:uncharacterized protein (DUF1499 family)
LTYVTWRWQPLRWFWARSSYRFGFTDDIVIRVAKDGSGSRVDMRSTSRQGHSDFGVNAARIRANLQDLQLLLSRSRRLLA